MLLHTNKSQLELKQLDACVFRYLKLIFYIFQDKRYLLLPWIYVMILVVLYDTGSVALLTTVHLEREKVSAMFPYIYIL